MDDRVRDLNSKTIIVFGLPSLKHSLHEKYRAREKICLNKISVDNKEQERLSGLLLPGFYQHL